MIKTCGGCRHLDRMRPPKLGLRICRARSARRREAGMSDCTVRVACGAASCPLYKALS